MILYKYLPPERIDVLAKRRIRFTQPADFNDPFEFRPPFGDLLPDAMISEYLRDNFERHIEEALAHVPPESRGIVRKQLLAGRAELHASLIRDAAAPRLPAVVQQKFWEVMNERAGLLCLSEVRDSVLMWGHYAHCHQGFVVGFDSEHSFFTKRRGSNDEFGFLRKVVYSATRPLLTPQNVESADFFQTKSHHWAYEKESRIMRVLSERIDCIEQQPFPICLFGFEPDVVREIIVGMRAAPALVAQIRALSTEFPRATVLAAKEHPTEFALRIEEVSPHRS